MATINEVLPFVDEYPARIRRAKEDRRLTISELAELSGVSQSVVAKTTAGSQVDAKLINAAALCKALGLSLDEVCGLERATETDEGLRRRLHESEVEHARISGEASAAREQNDALRKRLRTQRFQTVALLCICAMLVVALIAYLLIDLNIRGEGLILFGSPTAVAWGVILLVCIAVLVLGWSALQAIKD